MALAGGRATAAPLRGGVSSSRRRPTGRPNLLWVFADDVGIDQLEGCDDCNDWTGTGFTYTNTPRLLALALQSMRFRMAIGAPICSPARALALTGRLPNKTGVSAVINTGTATKLQASEQTFWDLIRTARGNNVNLAHRGKWHLANGEADYASILGQGGFDSFLGCATNPSNDNSSGYGGTSVGTGVLAGAPGSWWETDGSSLSEETTYLTTTEADDVIDLVGKPIGNGDPPWVCAWWAHSTHVPFHWAPTGLHSYGAAPTWSDIGAMGAHQTMLEAFDTELGRVLDAIWDPNTYVIFAADNGSVSFLVDPTVALHDPHGTGQPIPPANPYNVDHFKTAAYDNGIRIPFFVRGPGIQAGSVCDSLISIADLFATIPHLVVGPTWETYATGSDRVARSIVPCFNDPTHKPHAGEHVWAGSWYEAGTALTDPAVHAVRMAVLHGDHGYRLIVKKEAATDPFVQEWYEWGTDPTAPVDRHEANPLNPATTGTAQYRAALAYLASTFGLVLTDLSA